MESEIQTLYPILPKICSADTHQSRKEWDTNNPFQGHRAVITFLAQDILGGDILWAPLEGAGLSGNHFWNRLPDGSEIDFTKSQFGENPPNLKGEMKDRSFLFSSEDTKNKYQKLSQRYKGEVSNYKL